MVSDNLDDDRVCSNKANLFCIESNADRIDTPNEWTTKDNKHKYFSLNRTVNSFHLFRLFDRWFCV